MAYDTLVFNDSSGTDITNNGTNAKFTVYTGGGAEEGVDWSHNPNADPELSYFSAYETNAHWQELQPSEVTGPGTTVRSLHMALKFMLIAIEGGTQRLVGTPSSNQDMSVYATAGADFDLTVYRSLASQPTFVTFTGLSFNTVYTVSAICDVSTIGASFIRAALDGTGHTSGSTASWTSASQPDSWPELMHGSTMAGGYGDKRYYWYHYENNPSVLWSDANLTTVYSNPGSIIPGWPGGGGGSEGGGAYLQFLNRRQ